MKYLSYVLLSLLAISISGLLPAAEAQSTLNFPRQFQLADLQTTGFAVANPASTDAAVTFNLINDAGTVVATSSQNVSAKGQIARLGSGLFAGAASGGWVQATSSVPGLTGFWIGGDFATYTDGAESAPVGTNIVLPLVTEQTDISVVNLGDASNTIRIRLVGPDGVDLAPSLSRTLGKQALYQAQAGSMFPTVSFNLASYILLTSANDTPLAATSVVRKFVVTDESAVLNGIDTATAGPALHFPHVVNGPVSGLDYTTLIGVTNLASSSQTVSITFNPNTGASVTAQRSLAPGGTLRETAQSLFNLGAAFSDGWVRVSGSQTLTGFVAYGDTVGGGLAVVPPQPTPAASMLFAHVASPPVWYTGIALLNASDSAASVEISVMRSSGEQVGSTLKLNLPAKRRYVNILGNVIPEVNAIDAGFVIVRSNIPLFGIQLFGGTNGKILSNIAAGHPDPIPPGSAPIVTLPQGTLGTSGRVGLNSIELDSIHPHACVANSGNCYIPQAGFRIVRVRFDLFDRTADTISQAEALAVYSSITLSGSNFGSIAPFLIGATASNSSGVDFSVTIQGMNFRIYNVPAAPPYNVIYAGFEVPVNATGLKFNVAGVGTIDLGF
jgi:hypothetical protein